MIQGSRLGFKVYSLIKGALGSMGCSRAAAFLLDVWWPRLPLSQVCHRGATGTAGVLEDCSGNSP